MKDKTLYILILLLLVSCKETKILNDLEGVYCNPRNHCIYFDSNTCIVDKAKIEEYTILTNQEIELKNTDRPNIYQFEIDEKSIRLRKFKDEPFREFRRIPFLNKPVVENLYFSSVTESSDLELYISPNFEYQIRINYHENFESGNFKGLLPKSLFNFINQLVNSCEFNVKAKLKNEIISDIQEWAIKIKSDKEYYIYHNYEQVNQNHNNLALLLDQIPYFIKFEKSYKLSELNEIKEFREREFKRNLKENDL